MIVNPNYQDPVTFVGMTNPDRTDDYATFCPWMNTGIIATAETATPSSTNVIVTAGGGMTISVAAFTAMVNGVAYPYQGVASFPIASASAGDRRDIAIFRAVTYNTSSASGSSFFVTVAQAATLATGMFVTGQNLTAPVLIQSINSGTGQITLAAGTGGTLGTLTNSAYTFAGVVVLQGAVPNQLQTGGTGTGLVGAWTVGSQYVPPAKPDLTVNTDCPLAEIYVAYNTTSIVSGFTTATNGNIVDKSPVMSCPFSQTAINNTTTFQVPVSGYYEVTCVGGGGGGSGGGSTSNNALQQQGGGGGAQGESKTQMLLLIAGVNYAVVVGAAGLGGTGALANGNTASANATSGGNTTFGISGGATLMLANGGEHGWPGQANNGSNAGGGRYGDAGAGNPLANNGALANIWTPPGYGGTSDNAAAGSSTNVYPGGGAVGFGCGGGTAGARSTTGTGALGGAAGNPASFSTTGGTLGTPTGNQNGANATNATSSDWGAGGGGGGGGGGGTSKGTGGNGGNGGPGVCIIKGPFLNPFV